MADDSVVSPRTRGGTPRQLEVAFLLELSKARGEVGGHRILTRREIWIAELVAVPAEKCFGDIWISPEEPILHHAIWDEVFVFREELKQAVPDRELGAKPIVS